MGGDGGGTEGSAGTAELPGDLQAPSHENQDMPVAQVARRTGSDATQTERKGEGRGEGGWRGRGNLGGSEAGPAATVGRFGDTQHGARQRLAGEGPPGGLWSTPVVGA